MKKNLTRVISAVLTVVMLITSVPIAVFAQGDEKPQEFNPVGSSSQTVFEDEALRTENSKTYVTTDNRMITVVSAQAMHYEKDGEYREIDNTLVSGGYNKLTNKDNLFDVELPKKIKNGSEISVSVDDIGISFELLENVNSVKGDVEQCKSIETKAVDEGELNAVASNENSSSVTYADVLENTDIIYSVKPTELKENVVLKSQPVGGYSVSYKINTTGLSALLRDDNSVEMTDSNDEVRFTLPAPFMYDSQNAVSYDVSVTLEQADGGYILTYIPNGEWLADASRVYPITVDPVVKVQSDDYITDSFVSVQSSANDNMSAAQLSVSDGATAYFDFSLDGYYNYGSTVTSAKLGLYNPSAQADGSFDAYVYSIDSDFDLSAVTWANKPTDGVVIDRRTLTAGEYTEFDITKATKMWYTMLSNSALRLVACNGESGTVSSMEAEENKPYLIIEYVDVTGINAGTEYHTQDVGDAGKVYLNDYTGKITVERTDMSFTGNIAPVDITFYWYANEADLTQQNPYGYGWHSSFDQRLEQITVPDGESEKVYYRLTSGDGTVAYYIVEQINGSTLLINEKSGETFKLSQQGGETKLESGFVLNDIDSDGETITIGESSFNSSGTVYAFNSDGMLCGISTSSEVKTTLGTSVSANTNVAVSRDNDGKITAVTDGAGRVYCFEYANGMLASVKYYGANGTDGEPTYKTDYTYDSNENKRLVSVCRQGLLTANYEWSNILLTKLTSSAGYSMAYSYSAFEYGGEVSGSDIAEMAASNAKSLLNLQVCSIVELSKNATQGESINILYADNCTAFVKEDGTGTRYIYEFFNNDGSVYSYSTNDGFVGSATANGNVLFANAYTEAQVSDNYALNGDFEDANVTNVLTSMAESPSNYAYVTSADDRYSNADDVSAVFSGSYCGKFVVSGMPEGSLNGEQIISALAVNGVESGYYSMSMWVKTVGENAKISLTMSGEGSINCRSDVVSTNGEWQKLNCYGYATRINNTQCVLASINYHGDGEYYIDNVQLQQGWGDSPYNYVKNMDFDTADAWVTDGRCQINTANEIISKYLSNSCMKFTADLSGSSSAYQDIVINGKAGDTYTFGGFGTNECLPFDSELGREMYISIEKLDGTVLGKVNYDYMATFAPYYQYKSGSFTLEEDVDTVRFKLCFGNNEGNAFFDALVLYDDDVASTAEQEDEPQTGETEENTSPQNTVTSDSAYDSFGNQLSSVTAYNGTLLSQSYTYSDSGNFLSSSTDSLGNTAKYLYDENTSNLLSVTDADGNVTSYTYDTLNRLVKLSQGKDLDNFDSVLGEVGYEYNSYGELSKIVAANSTVYSFTYNEWGDIASVSVGNGTASITLAAFEYSGKYRSRLSKVTYANGHGVAYDYEDSYYDMGCPTKLSYFKLVDSAQTVYYTVDYGYLPNGTLLWQSDSVSDYKTIYTPSGSAYEQSKTVTIGSDQKWYDINHAAVVCSNGDMVEYIGDVRVKTTSGTSEHNGKQATSSTVKIGEASAGVSEVNDEFGRKAYASLSSGDNTVYSVSYDYVSNGNNTSERVAAMTYFDKDGNTVDKYEYSYTKNGSLAAIKQNGQTVALYTYDSLNQLVEELTYKTTSDDEYTKTRYDYDKNGNIVSKVSYSNANGGMLSCTGYSYADSVWKDRATKIGDYVISYDESGNMTSAYHKDTDYKCYEWTNFRCLNSYTDGTTAVEYTYNADGIRTSKTIDGVTTKYTLIGTKITSQTNGNDTMIFYYDSNDKIFGFCYNGANYFYVKNLQEDIVAIADEQGNIIAEYTYDAWGNCSYNANSTANRTIAVNNPFRYRSYYYDKDSKLYFLQSRYYDPSIGRFINSDDISYLGATGTVLSYNIFAYCENDAVNKFDPTGEWAADVHSGYYGEDNVYSCYQTYQYKRVKTWWRFFRLEKVITYSQYYGTYYWAKGIVGYSSYFAKIIAIWCAGVDEIYSPLVKKYQYLHFNTYWDKKNPDAEIAEDSRVDASFVLLICASLYFMLAQKAYDNGQSYRDNLSKGLVVLGMALHPLQDSFAHLRETSAFRLGYWEHILTSKGRKSDSVSAHWSEVNGNVRNQTVSILRSFYNMYPLLRKNQAYLFSNAYYKATKKNYRYIFGDDII